MYYLRLTLDRKRDQETQFALLHMYEHSKQLVNETLNISENLEEMLSFLFLLLHLLLLLREVFQWSNHRNHHRRLICFAVISNIGKLNMTTTMKMELFRFQRL